MTIAALFGGLGLVTLLVAVREMKRKTEKRQKEGGGLWSPRRKKKVPAKRGHSPPHLGGPARVTLAMWLGVGRLYAKESQH